VVVGINILQWLQYDFRNLKLYKYKCLNNTVQNSASASVKLKTSGDLQLNIAKDNLSYGKLFCSNAHWLVDNDMQPPDCRTTPYFDDGSMVYMSVVEDGASVAFAAYNEKTHTIIIEKCTADGYEIQAIAEQVLSGIRPTLALLSSKIISNESLLGVLTFVPEHNAIQGDNDSDEDTELTDTNEVDKARSTNDLKVVTSPARIIPYRLMKPSTYDRRICISNILKLNVTSLSRGRNQRIQQRSDREEMRRQFPLVGTDNNHPKYNVSNYHSLASIIDFDSTVLIQALGSLILFLQSTCMHLVESGLIHVKDIVILKSTTHMHLSVETLSSLQIFTTEHHPIVAAKGYGNSKEGFSLFSLLDRTKSRLGRQRLHEWMTKPLGDIYEISRRQDGVELFSSFPEMKSPANAITEYLDRVGAVDKLLKRIKKCCAKPNDFLLLTKALSSAVAIISTLHDEVFQVLINIQTCLPLMGGYQPRLHEQIPKYIDFVESILERCFLDELRDIFDRITDVIDEEKTFSTKEIIVRAGHHEQLDACKIQFARLQGNAKCAITSN
jgi:MutS domain III